MNSVAAASPLVECLQKGLRRDGGIPHRPHLARRLFETPPPNPSPNRRQRSGRCCRAALSPQSATAIATSKQASTSSAPTGPPAPYRLLMPSLIAFHRSWTLPLNATMAIIAITTSTPTKMAYSVVPCALSSRSSSSARWRARNWLAKSPAPDLASNVSHRVHVFLPTSSRLLPAAGPIWTEATPAR